jgi:hypothetical protein
MARTTKKELIGIILNILSANPGKEVCVVKYQNKLRNGRWGFHAFTLCAMNTALYGWVLNIRPWAGAEMYWRANLERLKVAELQDILNKCMALTSE